MMQAYIMKLLRSNVEGSSRITNLALGVLTLVLIAAPVFAVSYTLTVKTDSSSYTIGQTIHITGNVSPAPGPNTAVFVSVKNPRGQPVDFGSEAVDPNTGAFSHNTVTGGTASWVTGTYTVNATWGSSGTVIAGVTTFAYAAATTTTTTTTTSSTSTTTTTTTTTTSSTSTTTTTTTTTTTETSSTIPEFNPQALLVVSVAALAMVALASRAKLQGRIFRA